VIRVTQQGWRERLNCVLGEASAIPNSRQHSSLPQKLHHLFRYPLRDRTDFFNARRSLSLSGGEGWDRVPAKAVRQERRPWTITWNMVLSQAQSRMRRLRADSQITSKTQDPYKVPVLPISWEMLCLCFRFAGSGCAGGMRGGLPITYHSRSRRRKFT